MTAKYELIDRGGYLPTGYKFDPVVLNAGLPLEFFEARNAIRIAQSAGAEQYATESYRKAVRQMDEADSMATRKHENKKSLIAVSREVVEKAEDAREISVKHIDEERLAHERRAGANREASANNRADDEAQRRAGAEADTAEAQRRRREADRNNLDAQSAAMQAAGAQAGAERDRDSAQRQQQAAEAESDRNRANAASSDAQLQQAAGAQADAERDRNTAERDRNDAQQQQRAAEADSDRNRANAASSDAQLQQAVRDREEIRARLLTQFNLILETRDTARGLVVNMSDVLFDSGKYTLRPLAREKLAKISGIVLAYPTLRLAVEGNTDSVGTEIVQSTTFRAARPRRAELSDATRSSGIFHDRERASASPGPSLPMKHRKAANRIVEWNWWYPAKSSAPKLFRLVCNPSRTRGTHSRFM